MRAPRDPDQLLVETMLAPPALDDARRSHEYWQLRQKTLPFYQRRARREAREMAVRWQARVRAAERLRFESSMVGRVLAALGVSSLFVLPLRLTKWRLLAFAWAFVPRRIKLVAGGLVLAWLIVLIAAVTVAAAVFAQLS
jgi:hypothetical protein